ncbi:MAG: carboxynorspermidine decarboxylase [Proteobacteria bacterium]|nr:carboxynorspermidine decarboxylase [Pseudomonadota bacterium]MBU1686414.1 carboxynorspermidine decarboxylase [Pseudomonadota bacterium]
MNNDQSNPLGIDLDLVPCSPCFVVDEAQILRNLAVLDQVQQRTGCKILLALKGFAMFSIFPLLNQTLHGACASSLNEARLAREEFGREVHTFSPAYNEADLKELLELSDHLIFNSFSQWQRFRGLAMTKSATVQFGIRVNPEHSETEVALYDPCSPGSRLGVRRRNFRPDLLDGISGLHMHTLCEKNADALARTLAVFEDKFGEFVPRMKWINLGGGHHITRKDYNVDLLCRVIMEFKQKYGVTVYLEPGEAIALNCGILVTTVLDIIENDLQTAILDTSAATHMPDVLEMPYRPEIPGAGLPGEKAYTYRLGGVSCLAGDVIGEYSFDHPLTIGDRLAFLDMAHYSMVKTTTFNGVNLPAIALRRHGNNHLDVIRRFGYEDYKNRLS